MSGKGCSDRYRADAGGGEDEETAEACQTCEEQNAVYGVED